MKFYRILAIICLLLALTLVFCACSKKNEGGEEVTTEAASTEAETVPRFDYFAADPTEYISVDPEVYNEMEIELDDIYKIEESDLEERIEKLLISKKTVLNDGAKVTGEAIKKGDSAFIFYRGVIDGKEFEGGSNMGESAPYELSIGSGTFIDGFEDGLVGIIPSETSIENPVALNLKFPEDYGKEELNGKDVTFYVYVAWTVQYTVPEYDADFIKDVLKYETTETDIVAAHKEYLRKTLEESMEEARKTAIEAAIWLTLHDKVSVIKFPEGEVEYYYDSYLYEIEYLKNYYAYMGYTYNSLDEFAIAYLGLEKGADWKAEIKKDAENAVIQTLLTHYIAQKESLQLTDAEFEAEVQMNIDYYKNSGYNYTRDEVINLVGEEMIREGALYEKIVTYVKEHATITYKPVEADSESNESTENTEDNA